MPITGYRIYRGTWSGGETLLTTVGVSTSYTDETTSYGTTYYFQISALTAAGEGTRSNEMYATPQAPSDSIAPSKPGTPKALALGTSQIVIDWTDATDNVGVTGYQVFRNGVLVGSPTNDYFLDSGLSPATTYSYTVKAVDAAGNLSLASTATSAKSASLGNSNTTGTIEGVTFNSGGTYLANVVASVTVNGSVKTTKSSTSGLWKFTNLPVGTYTVTFTLSGYRSATAVMTVTGKQLALSTVELG
jgi:chitodextrinase